MTEQRIKSFPVSWEELHRTSKALAWRLLELGPFDGLIAVTRGGLVPAAIVARELEIRLIDTACISSYAGSERGKLDVLKPSPLAGDGSGWLIVDDLVDTGETAKALKLMMPKAHLATVYAKPAGRPLVDTFVTEVSQDTGFSFHGILNRSHQPRSSANASIERSAETANRATIKASWQKGWQKG